MNIKLSRVWYKYQGGKSWVLKNVNVEFQAGRITGIIGPNASGKTTLLKIASLLYKPTKGKVLVGNVSYWDYKRSLELKRMIVYVHEMPVLVRGDALYNVAYGLMLRGVPEHEAKSLALEIMNSMGIGYLAGRSRKELSSGEAQLVCIARAAVLKPKFLLLDEPTSHLDVDKRVIVGGLLKDLKGKGVSCIVATHDYLFASTVAEELLLLEEGRIVATGKPESLLENVQFL